MLGSRRCWISYAFSRAPSNWIGKWNKKTIDERDNLETPRMCFSLRHHIVTSWLVISPGGRPELHRPVVALDSWLRAYHRGKSCAAGSWLAWIDHDHREMLLGVICTYVIIHVVLRGSTFHTYCFCVFLSHLLWLNFTFVSFLAFFHTCPFNIQTIPQPTETHLWQPRLCPSFTGYILTPLCRAPILVMVATKQFRVNLSWCLSLLMNLRVFLCTATNTCKGRMGTGNTSANGGIVIQTFTFLLQLSYITNELVASVKQKAPEVHRLRWLRKRFCRLL